MKSNIANDICYYCNTYTKAVVPLMEVALDCYDLTLLLSGSLTYYLNGKLVILEAGDAIFFNKGDIRRRTAGNTPVHYISFNFLTLDADELPFDQVFRSCVTEDIKKFFSIYHPIYLSNKFHGKEKCLLILNYILYELSELSALGYKNEHVVNVIKFIDENITHPLSLRGIAEHFHLSKEHLSYTFTKETGTQLMSYINEQKMKLAKALILSEEMPFTSVSDYLGYENYDYFSKTFKKYVGLSPSQFKKTSKG